jgi:hypothetical protein
MSRRTSVVIALTLACAAITPGSAMAAQSSNVQAIASIPAMKEAISINFIGETMFVSTVHGVYSYDVTDPANPTLLGALPMYIWENEDVSVDPVRKLLFISRDPRGFTSPATSGATFPYGAVHIIDVSIPQALRQINVFLVPAGHTTTCVNNCDVIWTAGPYANAQTQPQFHGRPIFATDVRDPMNPVPCPNPIDTDHNYGQNDYVHDVQVDKAGVAWVSGQGGVRGYWTSGDHYDPLQGKVRTATGCDPVPYGGGGTGKDAAPMEFMHNAWRDSDTRPDVLLTTEENVVTDCKTAGRFSTYDLTESYDGEGFRPETKGTFTMKRLDTWTPQGQVGSTGCASAHYFTSRNDGITANAFYTQGVRFLDTSNPKDIRQVGYFVNSDSNTWAAYWHKGYVFVADSGRGVDILRFDGQAGASPTVRAPRVAHVQAAAPALRFSRSVFGGLCPLRTSRQAV